MRFTQHGVRVHNAGLAEEIHLLVTVVHSPTSSDVVHGQATRLEGLHVAQHRLGHTEEAEIVTALIAPTDVETGVVLVHDLGEVAANVELLVFPREQPIHDGADDHGVVEGGQVTFHGDGLGDVVVVGQLLAVGLGIGGIHFGFLISVDDGEGDVLRHLQLVRLGESLVAGEEEGSHQKGRYEEEIPVLIHLVNFMKI